MIAPNDWEIKKCLRLSLAIWLSLLGLIGMETLGFKIPVLRQMIGIVFLTFIPGILILRTLRVHNLGFLRTTIYSVGLSISFIIFIGLFVVDADGSPCTVLAEVEL